MYCRNSHYKSYPDRGWRGLGNTTLSSNLFVPDFYVAAMVMRSAASTLPRIDDLTVKIPHQDYMPKMAIKIIIKNSSNKQT